MSNRVVEFTNPVQPDIANEYDGVWYHRQQTRKWKTATGEVTVLYTKFTRRLGGLYRKISTRSHKILTPPGITPPLGRRVCPPCSPNRLDSRLGSQVFTVFPFSRKARGYKTLPPYPRVSSVLPPELGEPPFHQDLDCPFNHYALTCRQANSPPFSAQISPVQ